MKETCIFLVISIVLFKCTSNSEFDKKGNVYIESAKILKSPDWLHLNQKQYIPTVLYSEISINDTSQIANSNEHWSAGCGISGEIIDNGNGISTMIPYPKIRLNFLSNKGDYWYLCFETGGFVSSTHICFYEIKNDKIIYSWKGTSYSTIHSIEELDSVLTNKKIIITLINNQPVRLNYN